MAEAAEGKKGGVLQGRYEMGRVLGHGNFGRVHVARDLRTGQSVAVKVVAKEKVVRAGMVEQIKREIAVMKRVSHPNIVQLHEVMATRSKIYLALELVRGGELFARIVRSGRVKEDVARLYFRQLISAVDFCHARGVYHRDLKPENLLLDEAGNLKVVDFGLSALADHARADGLLHTLCGTPGYAAPEVLRDKGYDGAKADLWSCGVILYVLLAGSLPFADDNIVTMYKKVQRGDYRCPPWLSTDARRLIPKLLDPDPATRITVVQLVETPWFNKTSIARPVSMEPPVDPVRAKEAVDKDEPETLNAFHLIYPSLRDLTSRPCSRAARRLGGGRRHAVRDAGAGERRGLTPRGGRCAWRRTDAGDQEQRRGRALGGRGARRAQGPARRGS